MAGERTNGDMLGRGGCRDPEQMVWEKMVVATLGPSEPANSSTRELQELGWVFTTGWVSGTSWPGAGKEDERPELL